MNETCPHCGTNLRGSRIPDESKRFYGNTTHYNRTIGIEIQGVYDGVLFYRCPDCSGKWHRWEEGPMREKAEPYVNGTD